MLPVPPVAVKEIAPLVEERVEVPSRLIPSKLPVAIPAVLASKTISPSTLVIFPLVSVIERSAFSFKSLAEVQLIVALDRVISPKSTPTALVVISNDPALWRKSEISPSRKVLMLIGVGSPFNMIGFVVPADVIEISIGSNNNVPATPAGAARSTR